MSFRYSQVTFQRQHLLENTIHSGNKKDNELLLAIINDYCWGFCYRGCAVTNTVSLYKKPFNTLYPVTRVSEKGAFGADHPVYGLSTFYKDME